MTNGILSSRTDRDIASDQSHAMTFSFRRRSTALFLPYPHPRSRTMDPLLTMSRRAVSGLANCPIRGTARVGPPVPQYGSFFPILSQISRPAIRRPPRIGLHQQLRTRSKLGNRRLERALAPQV